jgi:hypothetical protein
MENIKAKLFQTFKIINSVENYKFIAELKPLLLGTKT